MQPYFPLARALTDSMVAQDAHLCATGIRRGLKTPLNLPQVNAKRPEEAADGGNGASNPRAGAGPEGAGPWRAGPARDGAAAAELQGAEHGPGAGKTSCDGRR